jgi:hypothetical protein
MERYYLHFVDCLHLPPLSPFQTQDIFIVFVYLFERGRAFERGHSPLSP